VTDTAVPPPPPPPKAVTAAAGPAPATTPPSKAGPPRKRFSLHGNLTVIGSLFYLWALGIAAWGSSTAAVNWLEWPLQFAVVAVIGVEIGGVYLLALADERRRLGEQAIIERLLSAAVAIGAVLLNWFGHQDHIMQAAFFAGMSGLAYIIWLIRSEHRRRDELRAAGKMRDTGPAYGLWRWLRHPIETAQARAIAIEEGLGLHESIRQVRLRKRMNAFVQWRLEQAHNRRVAKAIVEIYDPNRFAAELAEKINWGSYSTLMATELAAETILSRTGRRGEQAPVPLPTRQSAPPPTVNGAVPRAVAAATSAAGARAVTAPVDARTAPDLDEGDAGAARAQDRGRASRQRARGARPTDPWWTPPREKMYRDYARQLDETGTERSATELMPELGRSDGGARNARNSKFRERYAREVVEGARQPRAELPPQIAEEVARLRATTASLTTALPALEGAVRGSDSAS